MDNFESGRNGAASNGADRETLYLLGGVALVIFGAGLILSNPTTKRLMGQVGLGDLTKAVLPDFDRYMKLRSM